jgi:hypothetical protein
MASTANNMGIGPLNNVAFKRKYRWVFSVENIGGDASFGVSGKYVKTAKRPNITVEEQEINFLNGKTFIPGKATFDALDFMYYDVAVQNDTTVTNLLRWINRVYNFSSPAAGAPTQISATQRSYAYTADGQGYAGTGRLLLLDGCGYALEQWTLVNCWPTKIDFGDLDYKSSEECDISVSLRFSFATYQSNCNPFAGEACAVPVCRGNANIPASGTL